MDREDRIREVLEVHFDYAKILASRFAPFPDLADDIVHQAFLEFLQKKDQWDLSRDIRPLLASMLRNVARRHWAERMQRSSPEMRELAAHIQQLAEREPVAESATERRVAALRQCLDKLPEKSRKLVQTHYWLGFTSVEIGRQLEMNADAVRRTLFRIRAQLRKCVETALARQLT